MADARKEEPARSAQSQQLRRRLSVSLALEWLAYTVVFAVVALVLNVTLVPALANRIADCTSEWRVWEYVDYPLDKCLALLDQSFVGSFPTIDEASFEAARLNGGAQDGRQEEGQYKVVEVVTGAGSEDVVDAGAEPSAGLGGGAEDLEKSDAALVLKEPDGTCHAITLRDLQVQAIESAIYGGAGNGQEPDWQVVVGADSVQARDLSLYNVAKQFKAPVAIGLYLVGCIVLIFIGYGRAMRYFDELSSAVGGLMADREKPVELSPELEPTQDELNSIRLASLADERAAKYAERRKDELVAYLAHDIKTPLTSVMGYLMLLEEAPDMPREQRMRFVEIAAEKAQRLEALVDEFFEITRYNLQSMPVERANVDAGILMAQIADEFYPDAQSRGIEIEVDAPSDTRMFVDADKFARALGNVMRNAIAYADSDSKIALAAVLEDGRWRIEVRNSGREISEAHLKSIFEKFYREDAARSTSSGGAGLGLAIAKEIVTAHGGTISAESRGGVTTFTITVPE